MANSSLNPSPAPIACRRDGREPASDLPIAPRQQCAVRKIRPGQQQSQSPSGTGRVPNRRASSRERSIYRASSNNDPPRFNLPEATVKLGPGNSSPSIFEKR